MPFPGDLTTITVTASYPTIAGQPQTGLVTFDPQQVIADSTGKVILTGAVIQQIFNGTMQPIVLPCTDNSTLNPTGFSYKVTEAIGASTRSYQVQLPHTLGTTVDLSSLTPVTNPVVFNTFTGGNTWTAEQTFAAGFAVPTGASAGLVWTCTDSQGDGAWEASGAGLTNPMTSPGDMISGGSAGVPTRVAAQTTTTKKFLTETGTGSAGQAPAWSTIAAGDVPTLNQSTTGTAANVTGTVAVANGGTGQVTQQAAIDALAGAQTSGNYLRGNGTHVVMAAIQAADVPTLNQNTSGSSASCTGNAATATNLAGGATLPDYLAPAVATLTFVASGTTLVNAALGNAFNLTLTASTTTLGNPSNPVDGQVVRFRITQGACGSFTLAYAGNYDFGAAGSPTLSTAAAKVDILGFEYVASISKWCYLGSGLGF